MTICFVSLGFASGTKNMQGIIPTSDTFWRFCSIKRCTIYGLLAIMWPRPKALFRCNVCVGFLSCTKHICGTQTHRAETIWSQWLPDQLVWLIYWADTLPRYLCRLFKAAPNIFAAHRLTFYCRVFKNGLFFIPKKLINKKCAASKGRKKHPGGLVRPTSCSKTSRWPPLAAHMFYTAYKTLWLPVIAVDMLLCGLRPLIFIFYV